MLGNVKFDYDLFVKNGILFDTLFDTFQDLSVRHWFWRVLFIVKGRVFMSGVGSGYFFNSLFCSDPQNKPSGYQ